jgi:pseudouridine-5'-phosphate glycosidase
MGTSVSPCNVDVSADLTELGRTPVAVVCAGAKSVLDIPRTLEYLAGAFTRLLLSSTQALFVGHVGYLQ